MIRDSTLADGLYSPKFLQRVAALRARIPESTAEYYQVEFFAEGGAPSIGIYSQWVGYTTTRPRREIREADCVAPFASKRVLALLCAPAMVVDTPEEFLILWLFGGFGIVKKEIVKVFFPNLLKARVTLRDSVGLGYRGISSLPEAKLLHAPSRKLRMSILKRDQARCLICGRSPRTNVDVELHVHHMIPWGMGGITEP